MFTFKAIAIHFFFAKSQHANVSITSQQNRNYSSVCPMAISCGIFVRAKKKGSHWVPLCFSSIKRYIYKIMLSQQQQQPIYITSRDDYVFPVYYYVSIKISLKKGPLLEASTWLCFDSYTVIMCCFIFPIFHLKKRHIKSVWDLEQKFLQIYWNFAQGFFQCSRCILK